MTTFDDYMHATSVYGDEICSGSGNTKSVVCTQLKMEFFGTAAWGI